jgi:negative regulator of flagellin synthesis FlgM
VVLEFNMKIGQPPEIPSPVTQAVNAATQKSGQQGSASAVANANAAKSTRAVGVAVTVSTLARDLEKTESNADVDMQKVASMRSAIEGGTYQVNPEAIADKLLANAQELLNRAQG